MDSLGEGSQLLVTGPQDCGEVVETSPKQEGTSLNWEYTDIKERPLSCFCKVWGQGPRQQLQAQLVRLHEDNCREAGIARQPAPGVNRSGALRWLAHVASSPGAHLSLVAQLERQLSLSAVCSKLAICCFLLSVALTS